MQAEGLFQPQVVLQLLFPMGQTIVFEHPFTLTVQQENPAGRFRHVQGGVLLRCGNKASHGSSQRLMLLRIKIKGNALDLLFMQRPGQAPEMAHAPLLVKSAQC
ncbi:hypothetical protein D3C84_876260 [compost metagenome]